MSVLLISFLANVFDMLPATTFHIWWGFDFQTAYRESKCLRWAGRFKCMALSKFKFIRILLYPCLENVCVETSYVYTPQFKNGCNCLSMRGSKLIHDNKRGPSPKYLNKMEKIPINVCFIDLVSSKCIWHAACNNLPYLMRLRFSNGLPWI